MHKDTVKKIIIKKPCLKISNKNYNNNNNNNDTVIYTTPLLNPKSKKKNRIIYVQT